jgi:D-alanyl-lipoteichoic acid acyltransferase DltB (MBOAT superfamily)
MYAMRWLLSFLLLEFLLSKFPFFAIIKSGDYRPTISYSICVHISDILCFYVGMVASLSPHEIAVIAYVVLKMMWLKFLLIWRFFRLWSIADGILPPENMTRCMSNNCSLEGFWKGWHSSFNQWLVR